MNKNKEKNDNSIQNQISEETNTKLGNKYQIKTEKHAGNLATQNHRNVI